jgi:hypothetical protein
MREEIEKELSIIVGLPLWQARRVRNLHLFDFGKRTPSTNRQGNPIEYGEYSLHISCVWRIVHSDQIVVASNDQYYPPNGSIDMPEDFDWDVER